MGGPVIQPKRRKQVFLLANYVQQFLRQIEIFQNAKLPFCPQNDGIPMFSSASFPSLNFPIGCEWIGQGNDGSLIFVDALTWLRWSLRLDRPYLFSLSIRHPNKRGEEPERTNIRQIAFVRPLPFANRKLPFSIVTPLFAFNALGMSVLFGESGMFDVRIQDFARLDLEGIEIGTAEKISVKLVGGLEGEEEEEEERMRRWTREEGEREKDGDMDEAIRQHFSKPRLLYDGDLFLVGGEKKLIYRAKFESDSSCATNGRGKLMPKFVQRGQSECVELTRNENGKKNGGGKFPQIYSNLWPHSSNRHFLPKNIKAMAKKIAIKFWPFIGAREKPLDVAAQLVLLQAGSHEGAKLLLDELALLLDVRLSILDCLLDFWLEQQPEEKGAKRIEETIKNVGTPSICWINEIAILFPSQGQPTNILYEFDALLASLTRRLRPRMFQEDEENPPPEGPILFIVTCSSSEKQEMPERLRKLVQWEFSLADGDEKLDERERMAFVKHKIKHSTFEYESWELANKITEGAKGFTLLQLDDLIGDAERGAIQRHPAQNKPIVVRFEHFQEAFRKRAPQKGTKSKVDLADVGGLEEAKQLLKEALGELVKQTDEKGQENDGEEGVEQFVQIRRRTGILLYGPPGCGKTLLAKAVATEFGLAFYSVKGPELLSQYVGESERNLRELFSRARQNAPAVLFFDELDSLAPNRGANIDSGGVMDRMVSQLLTELDTCQWSRRKAIFVMGATNRPDLLDPCLLTPGRFDKLVPIRPAADWQTKQKILEPLCKNIKLTHGFSITDIAKKCPESMSGAELAGLVRSATMHRIREIIEGNCGNGPFDDGDDVVILSPKHFQLALAEL